MQAQKKPRLCRVNHDFEPVKKWVPGVVCFRLSANKAAMHTTNKYRPQVQSVGSKTDDNHAHRRDK